jgi:hypothetical protein
MTRDQCSNRAKPNHRKGRDADAWPMASFRSPRLAQPVKSGPGRQLAGLAGVQMHPLYRPERFDGAHFHENRGH